MLVNKVTTGFVIQTFDLDTSRCTMQQFVAGDSCDIETLGGLNVEENDKIMLTAGNLYYPYDMVQPGEKKL